MDLNLRTVGTVSIFYSAVNLKPRQNTHWPITFVSAAKAFKLGANWSYGHTGSGSAIKTTPKILTLSAIAAHGAVILKTRVQVHKLILRANKKKKTRQGKRSAIPVENGARTRHVAADIQAADLRSIGAVRTAISGAGPRLFWFPKPHFLGVS